MKTPNSDDSADSNQKMPEQEQWKCIYVGRKAKTQIKQLSRKHGHHEYETIHTALDMYEGNADGTLHITMPALNHNVVTLEGSVGMLLAQIDHLEQVTKLLIESGNDQQELI